MLIHDKHVPSRLLTCNKIQINTVKSIAHGSVDRWRSEDRNNPGNVSNAKAKCNVLLTAELFSTKKGKVAKSTGHKMYTDVRR